MPKLTIVYSMDYLRDFSRLQVVHGQVVHGQVVHGQVVHGQVVHGQMVQNIGQCKNDVTHL
jgi:hypothetical protein